MRLGVRGAPRGTTTLILVANRLPVNVRKVRGGLQLQPTTGGLATGLGAIYKEHGAAWIGWPGDVPQEQRGSIRDRLASSYGCHPVFLPARLVRRYYNGFSNRTVWPLFHSFPSYAEYSELEWEAYERANRLFRDRVVEIARPTDLVWVQDYHLMLLPRLIRERIPGARIGFFLHIPFPSYDILRRLPWHREIVEGLLGADLVGFHTYDDAQAFLTSVRRLFGYDSELGRIAMDRRAVQADVFPMGIDFPHFASASRRREVRGEIERIHRRIGRSKLVFSISRLDYTKGIPQQLRAIKAFLEAHREWRGKIAFLFVVVPSRENVGRYAILKRQVDELVGRINSRFGTLDWTPIRYIYRALGADELAALYASSDVALVAPLRDGMNLIAKEYLAARTDGEGVLILSEMAGAAKELRDALIVNPNSEHEVAEALDRALRMPADEQVRRNRSMRAHLEAHDIHEWGRRFLRRFEEVLAASAEAGARALRPEDERAIADAYARAGRRLLLLDYDGTLVPFAAEPGEAAPPREVLELLDALGRETRNELVLVSGRRREDLDGWFGALPATLVGEHGAWVHPPGGSWEATAPRHPEWKPSVREILRFFVDRVPGSLIEEKDTSLAWHYRRAEVGSASEAAKELIETLTNVGTNLDLQVLPGNKVVEVKGIQASKGRFFTTRLAAIPWDFILAIGDDRTDESLFAALPKDAHTIRVGFTATAARLSAESPVAVVRLLEALRATAQPAALSGPAAPAIRAARDA